MSQQRLPDTARLQQINTLLEAGLALPEDERDAWLRALPVEHAALAPLLRTLLQRAAVETDDFMRRPIGVLADDVDDAPPPRPIAPAIASARTACCSSWARAAWPRCGWPSAPTARCSGRWR